VMFQTAKGAILLQKTVPVRHILKVWLLGCPAYMIWRRPERLEPPQRFARCQLCTKEYKNGTIWCYEGCWMPLTWLGVQERIQHIARSADRAEELYRCYGLTFAELQTRQEEHGTASRNLPRGTFSDLYQRRQCQSFRIAPPGSAWSEKGHHFQKKARASARAAAAIRPAAAAVIVTEPSGLSSSGSTGQPAGSSTAPAGTTARLVPRGSVATGQPANPPLEGNSPASRAYRVQLMYGVKGRMSDRKIFELEKGSRKNKAADGTNFLSHTDRWNRCGVYRAQMQRDGTPKWLVWESNGFTVREDGQLNMDQWPDT
jgi:hypothetical protein